MLTVLVAVAIVVLIIATLRYPPLSLALYFTTTFVKATLMYKFAFFRIVDYTVLCAILVLVAMAYSFIKSRGRMRDILSIPVGLYLLLAFILILATTYTSAPNYGFMKSSRFATLGLIAFSAPIFFSRQMKNVNLMIWILLVCGVVLSVGTLVAPHAAVIRGSAETRASFLEASTLATASKIAWSVIIFFVFLIMKNTSFRLRIISLIMIPMMIAGMVVTGSRGPFLGIILTFLIAMIVCGRQASKVWQPVVIGVVAVAFIASFALLSEQLTSRIANMWKGKYEFRQATISRTVLFTWAVDHISERPVLGHGTGAWAVDWGGMDERRYPHNIVLEVLYEEGLIGLFVVLLFLGVIFRRWRQASRLIYQYDLDTTLYRYVHIGGLLFLFSLTQAMKSGDLDDNRFMFFCAGLVVAAFNLVRTLSEEVVFDAQFHEGDAQPAEQAVWAELSDI
jgi:O-antigen ligase